MDSKREIFLAVVTNGSFSKAAQALYMTQPAVSQYIKQYEKELGITLFDRTTKKLRLTAAGKLTYEHALQMKQLQKSLRQSLDTLLNEVKGELRIGASYSYGEYVLPKLLKNFLHQYPDVLPQISIHNTEHIAQRLVEEEIDIGIIEGDIHIPHMMKQNLGIDEMVVVANRPLLEIPAASTWLVREHGSGTRTATEDFLTRHELQPFHKLSFGSTQLIKSGVIEGLGISLLSKWTILEEIRQQKLFVIRPETYNFARDFSCIYRKEQTTSKVLSTFIDFLTEQKLSH